ncbi:MAG TPA: ABC transporter permease [Pyrinomonadaceae bacterium]
MKFLMQDIRYGLRLLRKNPVFTAATVSVLALSICATVTIFSVVNAVLLRPLPYDAPERLVAVRGTQPKMESAPVSPADFLDLKAQAQTFEEIAAYNGQSLNLTSTGDAERVEASIVSPSFFRVLAMHPLRGRTFTPEDGERGGGRLAVLSEGFWRRHFGGNPAAVGSTLTLNNETFEVVGVMPADFSFPERTDLWLSPRGAVPEPPIVLEGDVAELRSVRYLGAVGRVKPGVSVAQAEADARLVAGRLAAQFPETNEGYGVRLVSLHEYVVGDIKPALYALLGAVFLVLLIACSNVANLMLSRALARGKEMSIRVALGASRLRITQQLLTESVVLSLVGGIVGLVLAGWATDLLLSISPFSTSLLNRVSLDGRVVAVALLLSVLTGAGFGLVPALQLGKADLTGALKEGERGSTAGRGRHRLRNAFVVAQITLSFALLNCAGLMLKSFYRLQNVELGFNPENVLTMQVSLPRTLYSKPEQVTGFYDQTLQRIKALPGVKAVGATSKLPVSGTGVSGEFAIEGRPAQPGEQLTADRRIVTPDYFRAMSISLVSGRFFDERDAGRGAGLALINQAAAKRFWPGEDPVGRRIGLGGDDSEQEWLEIVGVVGDVRHSTISSDPKPEIYFPYFQSPWHNMTVVAKLDPAALNSAPSFRGAVLAVDRSQPVYNIRTMRQVVDEVLKQPRFNVVLLSVFAAAALVLTIVGLYGVMVTSVLQRTHEIGIRMALGARPLDIIRMILTQGALLVFAGLAAGLALAYAAGRSLSSLLFEVSGFDLITYATVSAVFVLVMLAASLIPARRASRVSPVIAIRQA